MAEVSEEEQRIGALLEGMGLIPEPGGAGAPRPAGARRVSWPLRFRTPNGRVWCTARVYERFNGSVVLCIESEVATVDDGPNVRRWATTRTGWMPFVQARLDPLHGKRVRIMATHSLLAPDCTSSALSEIVGSIEYVSSRWRSAVSTSAREDMAGEPTGETPDVARPGGSGSHRTPDPVSGEGLDVTEIDDLDIDGIDLDEMDPDEVDDAEDHDEDPSHAPTGMGLDEIVAEMGTMVGLAPAKSFITRLIAAREVARRRRAHGMKTMEPSPHVVLTGNPGTGKTTFARYLGRIYAELGLLAKGHLVEVDRAGLVAAYMGQTAIKTTEVLESASGGVLFIDEAYSLMGDSLRDYGSEAIETIMAHMENRRGDLVVVVAGYPREMAEFMRSNPGLASRFDTTLEFPDYSDEELVRIFLDLCSANDYSLTDGALEALRGAVSSWSRGHGFGNAREVRRLFHDVVAAHGEWVAGTSVTSGDLLGLLDAPFFPAPRRSMVAAPSLGAGMGGYL